MGLITGKAIFVDNSELHFMEYVEVAGQVKCQTYRYHYQDKTKKLIFRYDNAPHHPETPTHPHHKNVGSEILQSRQPALGEVMDEILQRIYLQRNKIKNYLQVSSRKLVTLFTTSKTTPMARKKIDSTFLEALTMNEAG